MIQIVIKILNIIGDQSNLLSYKLIAAFGFGGIGLTATTNIAKSSEVVATVETSLGMTEIASVISIVSGILFIIQRAYSMYLDHQKNKREEESHEKKMKEGDAGE